MLHPNMLWCVCEDGFSGGPANLAPSKVSRLGGRPTLFFTMALVVKRLAAITAGQVLY